MIARFSFMMLSILYIYIGWILMIASFSFMMLSILYIDIGWNLIIASFSFMMSTAIVYRYLKMDMTVNSGTPNAGLVLKDFTFPTYNIWHSLKQIILNLEEHFPKSAQAMGNVEPCHTNGVVYHWMTISGQVISGQVTPRIMIWLYGGTWQQ